MTKRFYLILTLFIILLCGLIFKSITKVIYFVPNTNFYAFKSMIKLTKTIDLGFDYAIKNSSQNNRLKILYKNAYGSGFLKYSNPNDLDLAIGIDLGILEYDGTEKSANEIAKNLEDKITTFKLNFYEYFNSINPKKQIITDKTILESLIICDKKRPETIKNISDGIIKNFNGEKNIILRTQKMNENINVTYAFPLKKDEIFINSSEPLTLYSPNVLYNDKMEPYLREISIIPQFFVSIKDTRTDKIHRIKLIEETFLGQILPLYRRFFAPMIFWELTSARSISKFSYLNSDEEFFEIRLLNYLRHFLEVSNPAAIISSPLKIFKRMEQCLDIISPAIDKNKTLQAEKMFEKIFSNEQIFYINEYFNALKSLQKITMSQNLFYKANAINQIEPLLLNLHYYAEKINDPDINKFQNELEKRSILVKNPSSLEKFHEFLFDNIMDLTKKSDDLVKNQIDQNDFELLKSLYKDLENILIYAGFRRIDYYWINKTTIGILKNKNTQNISLDVFKNQLPAEKFVFIDSPYQDLARITWYFKVSNSPEEAKAYNKLKETIIRDRKNFKPKYKFYL